MIRKTKCNDDDDDDELMVKKAQMMFSVKEGGA